ncbi:reverse transcriptase (RNA-dependent DNA polymerase) domain-containing protein [Phthorimaea operculella]|nr:reverse transcriptase (RNA-dependent DNA polymerase) domain-containing protein [Phthorimaea operculella]
MSDGDPQNGDGFGADASDGDRHSEPAARPDYISIDDSSTDPSSEEEGQASPPPNKRSRRSKPSSDPRIDILMRNVSFISGYMTQLPHYITQYTQHTSQHTTEHARQPRPNLEGSTSRAVERPSATNFLVNPCQNNINGQLQLGGLNVEINDKAVIPKANPERLEELKRLQQFDSPAWKGIRYKSTLRTCTATPGFLPLKVNEELCHFNKTKDYLESAEGVLAGLSNTVLEQKQLLQQSLQGLVNWAAANPQDLTPNTLFEKVSALFGPNSNMQKCADNTMQIICGRRKTEWLDKSQFFRQNTGPKRRIKITKEILYPFVPRPAVKTPSTVRDHEPNKNDYAKNQEREFLGGCLKDHVQKWLELGANKFVIKVVTGSYIPLKSKPPMNFPTVNIMKKFATKPSTEMSKIIKKLKEQGVLEKPPIENPGFHSKMFLVKKPDGSSRPIFDLRGLNQHVKEKHFHLISQTEVTEFIQRRDWLVKIDLNQAYFQVPISQAHRRFLRVIYEQEILQLTALPFGLSSAPRTFAALTNWVAEQLRARGVRIIVYLDDFLLAHQEKSILASHVSETVKFLLDLGWHVNFKKSVMEPTQELEYLGLLWNTANNCKSLPAKKVEKIERLITEIKQKEMCSLKQMQCLLGCLNFANITTPRGRIHCRYAQRFLKTFKQKRPRLKKKLPAQVCQELDWWLVAIKNSTVALHCRPVTHFLTTDAADVGWGAQLNEVYLSGSWTAQQRRWHSNLKEMYAVYGAISSQKDSLQGAHIHIQSDNRTLVAYVRHEGGTRSLALLELTTRLMELTEQLEITLTATYLPGRYNGIADRLSRNRPVPEWHLLPQASAALFKIWGVPDVDLFASKRSAVVRPYVTWDKGDKNALFCDAFSQRWQFRLAWVFPPPNLMPRVLNHLNSAEGKFIVIAPNWTQCSWLPDLKSRALEEPIVIPALHKNLLDLTTGMNPPQIDNLQLLAWKIGGGPIRLPSGHQKKKTC